MKIGDIRRITEGLADDYELSGDPRVAIYIAGAIKNDPDHFAKFGLAEARLKGRGFNVYNPARNQGFSYRDFIDAGLDQLRKCDAIYMLKGWERSTGARLELQYAEACGLSIIYQAKEEADAANERPQVKNTQEHNTTNEDTEGSNENQNA